jgi:hypothetical protein
VVRRVSSLLLAIGLIAAVVAAVAVSVETVVLDATRVRAAGGAVLATGPVRRELVPRVASEIRTEIPGANALTPAQLNDVATRTLSEPAFVRAFSDGLVDVRDRVFGGGHGRVLLDPHGVATAVAQASTGVPALDGPGATSGLAPHVVIDAGSAPHLPVVATATRTAGRVALAVAVLALLLAVPAADRPRRALARVARCAVVVGVVQIVVLWLVPRFVLAAFGAWPDVAAALMRTAGARIVLIAIAAVVVGSVVLAVLGRLDAASRSRFRDAALDDLRRRTQWSPPPPLPAPHTRRPRPRSGV